MRVEFNGLPALDRGIGELSYGEVFRVRGSEATYIRIVGGSMTIDRDGDLVSQEAPSDSRVTQVLGRVKFRHD